MAYELRDNSGTLFKNDKGDNPKRPDYRGDLLVEGVLYELSAWIKEGNKGKFMSLSCKPKEAKPEPKGKEPARRVIADEDLDTPF
jgi:hypothetical protein